MAAKKSAGVRKIDEAKKMIVEAGHQCWRKGWVAGSGGNISYRLSENEILCTPTGVSKGMLTEDLICLIDGQGKTLMECPYAPSSEIKMHLRVFKERPDVSGVVHAHPPYATAHAVAGIPFTECVIPEIFVLLGTIPIAPYGTPSTNEVPDRLAPLLKGHDAWLLENHGALTVGKDPLEAYLRMEMVELYAQTMAIAKGLGRVNTLDEKNVRALLALREKIKP